MDIDLLFTRDGEAGLICSENLVTKAAGAVFDTQTGILTLEFTDMDFLEMNIPVDGEFFGNLDFCIQIHIGAIKNGNIAQAYQVPFMFLDDPYKGEAFKNIKQRTNPLVAFDHFVKACVSGQPVHREDLSDDTIGCVLGDSVPSSLQFAPHLARKHTIEASPKTAPSAPGMSAPGLGGGGSSGHSTVHRQSGQGNKDKSD
ncbi:MAG: hypothetical protein KAJ86_03760 [Alphaproteobacteria bacterium]|nr:hypothetical protein [Alphaproteobacteria bacterium]